MAGLGGALSGLAAAYPGYVQGRQDENKADMSDLQLDEAKKGQLAKVAMGNALMLLAGGGQGPQPPAPGQSSQPMGGGGPPGGPPPGMMSPQPMAQQPPPQGMPPQQMGGGMPPGGAPGGQQGGMGSSPLDWRTVLAAVKQANPNLPPDVAAQAVTQFLPMMNQQSQQEWRMMSLQLREQSLQERESRLREAEAGRNTRSDTLEAGRNTRADASREQRGQQFEQREGRLQEGLKLREDSTWARLDQQKQQAAQKAEAAQGREGLAEWRAAVDAQHKHVLQRIQAYSAQNTMKPAERKALLDEADKSYRDELEQMRTKFGRSTPGGTTGAPEKPAPGAAPAPKAQDKVGTSIPPDAVSQLKEGQVTTFQNGQKWTLKNGKPEQVP